MENNLLTSRGIKKAQEVEPLKNAKDINKVKTFLKGKKTPETICYLL